MTIEVIIINLYFYQKTQFNKILSILLLLHLEYMIIVCEIIKKNFSQSIYVYQWYNLGRSIIDKVIRSIFKVK